MMSPWPNYPVSEVTSSPILDAVYQFNSHPFPMFNSPILDTVGQFATYPSLDSFTLPTVSVINSPILSAVAQASPIFT